jgi:hypothetical protein
MPAPQINVAVNGNRIEPRLIDQITRLEVRESDDEATMAALRFRLVQQPSGAFSPLDDNLFTAGSDFYVEIAAPGGNPVRVFSGYVTHIRPHFESIEANCYLEVLAMDAAVLLDAGDRAASYPDASDSEAIEQVLGRYNIRAVTKATAARHKQDYQLLMQRGTDWDFVRRLADRNGYCSYFEYNSSSQEVVGYFQPRDLTSSPQADLTMLRPPQSLLWIDLQILFTGPIRYIGSAIDPIRKQLVRSQGDPELAVMGEEGLPDQIESAWTSGGADSASAWLRDPFPADAAIGAEGTGATDLTRFVIEARGEIDCSLYRGLLRPRKTVLIKGTGKLLSGTYYVRTVRTTVDNGALSQTFIAERNALNQSGQEEFGQSAQEVQPT